jgi:hypothetical protein
MNSQLKIIAVLLLALLQFKSSLSQQSVSIGKCRFFYQGKQPKNTTIIGRMKVYHNGDLKKKFIEGRVNVWTCTGTVWVIFDDRKTASENRFIGGAVQTCNNF